MDAVSKNVGKYKQPTKMQSTKTPSTKMQTKYFEEKTIRNKVKKIEWFKNKIEWS